MSSKFSNWTVVELLGHERALLLSLTLEHYNLIARLLRPTGFFTEANFKSVIFELSKRP